jgi:hypothetical protein
LEARVHRALRNSMNHPRIPLLDEHVLESR